ncbi:MAG: IPT/TIG domain-containing protein [Blastocatellia bacterium]|nr:IPT/TIG domain-containing protein [Blastocatellia bacterium]
MAIKQKNPVANEGSQISLTALESNGQPATGVIWSSGSPEIAQVDPQTGVVRGVQQGYATLTVAKDGASASVFVTVVRVRKGNGEKVPGDTKVDPNGQVYLSNPTQNVILKATEVLTSATTVWAGRSGVRGLLNATPGQSLFAGPTAIAIDNRPRGGVLVADTLNHCVRKIGFSNQVETLLGTGAPGITPFSQAGTAAFEKIRLHSPHGIAVASGGNLFVADTDNHAVYYVDQATRQVQLLAGQPGEAGRQDGGGQQARFFHPAGLTLDTSGKVLAVADRGNNQVRLLELTKAADGKIACTVTTISTTAATQASREPIAFSNPESVSFDSIGNLSVVDATGVFVVTQPLGLSPQKIDLAQPNVSFAQPVSVTVRGTETFVLDAASAEADTALNVVTVGAPDITSLSRDVVRAVGGEDVTVLGKNFAPDSLVTLGDAVVENLTVVSATELRFRVPKQRAYGDRTVSIQTRGGLAQKAIAIIPKPFSELAVGEVTTIAGGLADVGDGKPATESYLGYLTGLVVDGSGNLSMADANRIRRVSAETQVVTTVAGSGRDGVSADGMLGVTADLKPVRLAQDGAGNYYFIDGNRIRRLDAITGRLSTVAGNGLTKYKGDGVRATKTGLAPNSLTFDTQGNLFLTDYKNNQIRRVDAKTNTISTIAGNGTQGFNGDSGQATQVALNNPQGLAVDALGNLFFSDSGNQRIRRVDARTGMLSTIAGKGVPNVQGQINGGYSGDTGPASQAELNNPGSLAFDAQGNLYVADVGNFRIRRIGRETGLIATVVGIGPIAPFQGGFRGDGGPATEAQLSVVEHITLDGLGNLYIGDSGNYRVRQVDARTGIITTIVGAGKLSVKDGTRATSTFFLSPNGIALDSKGNILVCDSFGHRVYRIDGQTWLVSNYAGNGNGGPGGGDGGPATSGVIREARQITLDTKDNLFITDTADSRIRQVDAATGVIATVAGTGRQGFFGDGGLASNAGLSGPFDSLMDKDGNLLIADSFNNRVRRVDGQTNLISTLITPEAINQSDVLVGGRFFPISLVLDKNGVLFISDNNRIRRYDPVSKIIKTIAGGDEIGFAGDGGPASKALLGFPEHLCLDGAGNLFFSDSRNGVIRKIDAQTGIISTVAGNPSGPKTDLNGDGGPARNAVVSPRGMAFDRAGNLLFSDGGGSVRIVKGIAVPGLPGVGPNR